MPLIQARLAERIGTIAFDNYAKRNALSGGLIAECLEALSRFEADKARAVVIRSAAPQKVWSAGHAVDELPQAGRDPLSYDDPLVSLLRAVRAFPAPVIAMVQGSAWGGACDLVMSCDIVLGDETCAFAITPAKLGLPYNALGVLHFLNRLPLNIVTEMFCTAEPVGAERALGSASSTRWCRRRSWRRGRWLWRAPSPVARPRPSPPSRRRRWRWPRRRR